MGLAPAPGLLFVNAYLVRSGGATWVVVDTGPPGNARRILAAMDQHGISAGEVSLILLTHGHFDHFGSALELQRLLYDSANRKVRQAGKPAMVPIAMHSADRPYVSGEGFPSRLRPISAAGAGPFLFGTAYYSLLRLAGGARPWPREVLDRVLWLDPVGTDDWYDLGPLCGFDARARLMPGHSPGSVSLLLPDGAMLTGDLVVGTLFAENRAQAAASLRAIAAQRPPIAYPGHGAPLDEAGVDRAIERLLRILD